MTIQNPLYGRELSEGEAAIAYQPKNSILTTLSNPPANGDYLLSVGAGTLTWATPTTDLVPEGTTKLYFTTARAKAAITGAASTVVSVDLTPSRVAITDPSGKLSVSTISVGELGYLSGTTSSIQTQLNTITGRAITAGTGLTGGGTLSANVSLGVAFESTPSTLKAAGGASVGTANTVPRADHVHPSDTTKVGVALMGAANGVATLDSNVKVPTSQIPSITTTVGFGGEVISVPYTGSNITIPLPVSQGGTGVTSSAEALSVLGGQPIHQTLTSIGAVASEGILVKDTLGMAQVRSIQVNNPLTIANPTGSAGSPTISLSQGHGSGLDADLLDGAHGSTYFKVDGSVSYSVGTATTIRTSITAASSGVNTDITSLGNVGALGNTSTGHLRITTAGEVLVGKSIATSNGGDVQVSRGLTFPFPQVPCSNTNTLDDYREGTWAPSIDSAVAGTGRVTTVRYATFTKVGNLVTFTAFVDMGTLGTGGSGALVINGLPYTASPGANAYWAVTVPYFASLKAAVVYVGATVQTGGTQILFRGWPSAVQTVPNLDFNTYVQLGTAFILSGFYYTA